ncbi:OLC1v1019100C1 [Oldenlandia corymbosa var. corymbosa]|uniref:OLC1v1019100C1 n=1 Tax=Oldenlandia corymbosa var. corymbosa TaxID=529605 RepID=A0AAV1ED85_OLDCO|nr:OLC1v1019100C1 [Oldenlandia corymbosa var. corymbosa]
MGKCSAFDDSDEEEPSPEKNLIEAAPLTDTRATVKPKEKIREEGSRKRAVQAIGSFVTVCANLEWQVASARKKAFNEANKVKDAEARVQALTEEKGARKALLKVGAAKKKKEDIRPILDKYADRAMKGRTSAVRLRCKARRHFRDMDFALLPVIEQMSQVCPTITSPEDILNIPGSPSFVFKMSKGVQTSQGPDEVEQPKDKEAQTPPKEGNSSSQSNGGTSTDSNTSNGDKGKKTTSPPTDPPEGNSQGVPPTPGKWETSGIPWTDMQLPDPYLDTKSYPIYAAVGRALTEPPVDRGRGRLSGLEDQLKEALSAIKASNLDEARRAVVKLKGENDRLDRLRRDTEAYWEDHMKNSMQLEMLANEHLWTFEAKIRKNKKDNGLPKPDPKDFIPRNYYESVSVHLRKAYTLVAVKWDRASDKIESLRAYIGQLRAALEGAVSFIVESGKIMIS